MKLSENFLRLVRPVYHGFCARFASFYNFYPSNKLVVIGVTGTAGKSSTVNMLAHILNSSGKKTGFITTTNFNTGTETHLNKHGLSMPNEWLLQKQLAEMVKQTCEYAVIEATSEGLAQNRHLGINFDAALLTNLTPAHIDSHGSFENYKQAKGRLFSGLGKARKKKRIKKKIIGANLDDEHAEYFLRFPADTKFGVSRKLPKHSLGKVVVYTVGEVETSEISKFKMEDTHFTLTVPGEFSVYNAMLAIACANILGVDLAAASLAMSEFKGVPGRMEFIENTRSITAIVDYACEPKPLLEALKAVNTLPHKRIIHIFGSTGGHRDKSKRFDFGRSSARLADISIITNDDVYDSDPKVIADNILEGFDSVPENERRAKAVKVILDRRKAITEAVAMAEPGDLLIFTGKGSEQFLVLPGNKRIEWDEREVVRRELGAMAKI